MERDLSHPAHRTPPGLLVGVIGMAAVSIAAAIAWRLLLDDLRGGRPGDHIARLQLAQPAARLALLVVTLAGAIDLMRRLPGRRQAWRALAVGGLLVVLAFPVIRLYLDYGWLPGKDEYPRDALATFATVRGWAVAAGALAFSVGLIGAGWSVAQVRALAVPLALVTLLAWPPPPLWRAIDRAFGRGWASVAIDLVVDAGFAVLTLLVARQLAREVAVPIERPRRLAAEGFRRAGTALVLRVVLAVAAALTFVAALGGESIGLLELWLFGVPIAITLINIMLIAGLLGAAGLFERGAPRARLYGAAACTLFAMLVQAVQVAAAYQLANGNDFTLERELVEVMQWIVPGVALAGLLLLVSAIHALATRLRGRTAPEAVVSAGIMVVVFTAATVGLQHYAMSGGASSRGEVILFLLLGTAATIIAQLAIARRCRDIAGDLEVAGDDAPPPARVIGAP